MSLRGLTRPPSLKAKIAIFLLQSRTRIWSGLSFGPPGFELTKFSNSGNDALFPTEFPPRKTMSDPGCGGKTQTGKTHKSKRREDKMSKTKLAFLCPPQAFIPQHDFYQ